MIKVRITENDKKELLQWAIVYKGLLKTGPYRGFVSDMSTKTGLNRVAIQQFVAGDGKNIDRFLDILKLQLGIHEVLGIHQ